MYNYRSVKGINASLSSTTGFSTISDELAYITSVSYTHLDVYKRQVVFHVYVYGDVPPDTLTVALPLCSPKQRALLLLLMLAFSNAGCVMVTIAVSAQPLASVTVAIYVPAARLLAEAVVCAGVVFQLYVYGVVPPLSLIHI